MADQKKKYTLVSAPLAELMMENIVQMARADVIMRAVSDGGVWSSHALEAGYVVRVIEAAIRPYARVWPVVSRFEFDAIMLFCARNPPDVIAKKYFDDLAATHMVLSASATASVGPDAGELSNEIALSIFRLQTAAHFYGMIVFEWGIRTEEVYEAPQQKGSELWN